MPLKTHQTEQPSLNLTPMIDIVFLLIIFFMVGTKFTELERKISLQVPEVNEVGALAPAPEKRVINVHRDGRVALDDQFMSLRELTAALKRARKQFGDLEVLIRGDKASDFEHVAHVLAACRQAGMSRLGVSVRVGSRQASRGSAARR